MQVTEISRLFVTCEVQIAGPQIAVIHGSMKCSSFASSLLISILILGASLSAHAETNLLPVDDSLLAAAQPLSTQASKHALRYYQMETQAVDRRFTCIAPTLNLKIVVEIAHINDQAHTATLQLINPVGVTEASFLTTASRLPRYPEVHLDSYKIRFGDELSTLVINAHRATVKGKNQIVSGMLQSAGDPKVELINCEDEFVHPDSLKALDAPWEQNFKNAKAPESALPKSVCLIRAFSKDLKDNFICSAVLVDKHVALTANHCLQKMKDHMASFTCPGQAPVAIDIEASSLNEIHSQEPWRVAQDIAVLKLKSDVNIEPAQLVTSPTESADLLFAQGDSCGLFGYGSNFDGKMGDLHGVKYAVPPEDLGGVSLSIENFQSEKLITSDPRFFLRPGDSGGGVICHRGTDEVVLGIHSFSYPIDSTVNSASVGHNYEWIVQQINKLNGVNLNAPSVTDTIDPNLTPQSKAASTDSTQTW